ncbi:FG-GAP-like repeat-containing protein [Hymenobacter sp. H14-R3]|uniref:FG-GAP-like repeat-containing protein n=1 Tax=Hymenobacter sp. H14-R3 TaxID=3046308 RepID=UPI0024B9669D|nr:FG-GAP-like repeat-containing protein [Hymenobacter sp. H14-R3]MDJ0367967.1 FG-GAP-like repeat-containing protein [Hymenobacter sp. H14-R3]
MIDGKLVLYFLLLACSSILTGHSQHFRPAVQYAIGTFGSNPRQVVTADLNGDSYLDLITANYTDQAVGVLRNRGDGTFTKVVAYPLGPQCTPYGLAVGDVDQDGHPDLVTANYEAYSVSVLLNKGDGTFSTSHQYPVTSPNGRPKEVVLADVNGDRTLDILTVTLGNPTLSVFLNQGNGRFGPAQSYAYASSILSTSLTVTDVNRDGHTDVIIAHFADFNTNANWVSVLLNEGAGKFGPLKSYALGANSAPFGVTAADVNNDGYPDLLTANYGTDNVSLLLNDKQGNFMMPVQYATGPGSQPLSVLFANITGDGRPALITANYGHDAVGILPAQLNGTGFGPVADVAVGAGTQPGSVVAADFDKNGRIDIATSNSNNGKVSVLLNQLVLASRNQNFASTMRAYPNPIVAGGLLCIESAAFPLATTVEIALFDAAGRHIWTSTQPGGLKQLFVPTQKLSPGWYMLRITNPTSSPAGSWSVTQPIAVQ